VSIKVEIKDFQSIENATIVVDGFTAISGQNNIGKSAVIRAIMGVFENTPGKAFVRSGAANCSVTVTFDSGDTVTWEKGKTVRYEVNGKSFNPGKAVPEQVKELGVREIIVADKKLWPQMSPQDERMFLLNRDTTGAVVAEAIADVERVGRLNSALKLSERQRKSAQSRLKVRRGDVEELETRLEGFDGLVGVEEKVRGIESAVARCEKIQRVLGHLCDYRDEMSREKETIQRLRGIRDIDVPTEGELQGLGATSRNLTELRSLSVERKQARRELNRCRELLLQVEAPSESLVKGLRDQLTELQELRKLRSRYRRATQQVETLSGIGGLELPQEEVFTRLDKVGKALASARELRSELVVSRKEVRAIGDQLVEKEKELEELDARVTELWGDVDSCPVCGLPRQEDTCA
jgi:DNA repair ATPase RecN